MLECSKLNYLVNINSILSYKHLYLHVSKYAHVIKLSCNVICLNNLAIYISMIYLVK